jgi:hypothetical protein
MLAQIEQMKLRVGVDGWSSFTPQQLLVAARTLILNDLTQNAKRALREYHRQREGGSAEPMLTIVAVPPALVTITGTNVTITVDGVSRAARPNEMLVTRGDRYADLVWDSIGSVDALDAQTLVARAARGKLGDNDVVLFPVVHLPAT